MISAASRTVRSSLTGSEPLVTEFRIVCVGVSLLSRIQQTARSEGAPLAPAITVIVNTRDKSWILCQVSQLGLVHWSPGTSGTFVIGKSHCNVLLPRQP